MSNQQVGTVFDRVIQEVCDASQVDFEESGVDQQTLLDLRKSWQKKLSSLGVAHFPWDPAPPQPAPPQNQNQILPPTAPVPSNAPRPAPLIQTQQQHVPQQQQQHPQSLPGAVPPMQTPAPMGQPPHIKTEPGLNGQSGLPHMNNMMPVPSSNPQSARERAANMLHQRYGAAAASSVSQLQAQSQAAMGMPGQPRPQNPPQIANGQIPQIKQEPSYPSAPQPHMHNSQTDGACDDALSDWKAEVARRREAAARQNGEGDRLLRDHLRQRMLEFEGGGLLTPLDERQSMPSTSRRDLLSIDAESSGIVAPFARPERPRAQFDGPGGDDDRVEDDEDAINSDLDDPDDLVAEDHDAEDAVGQVMLCTYDKVQRVKNKWKCTLKDGILTTGGKEYVFHKGQGEFEW
ncbi:transcription initiation factor IIA large subunit [Aspergillus clavatus NRRL 1]|uniref:Transcription initiation factor IIA large subunit n=1 Tax=Aspergillus clavatus (strain ATCC 1007 / CBS 513.65 / DSM 816 / NCTC 3887 / NRRL 1 / QM 1276 / 107) TaxID=344612 RepID=A1CNY5_ASPCL|nr:transcription factor TFIIA complex subunit Toa1, putative [Aspergillus clavatus NRRL 1]EAW07356.1 transcription factor TFIIA complex subunit Toa1, putative [Aspergillus clavatus NRRL 1]